MRIGLAFKLGMDSCRRLATSLKRLRQRRALAFSSIAFSHWGKSLRTVSRRPRAEWMSPGSWLESNCLACPRCFSANLRLLTHKWRCSRASEGMVVKEVVALAFTPLLARVAKGGTRAQVKEEEEEEELQKSSTTSNHGLAVAMVKRSEEERERERERKGKTHWVPMYPKRG